MMGMTEQKHYGSTDEEQIQSALRAMVVLSIITFQVGHFIRLLKCFLIPEKVMTYLGIQCDSLRSRFSVPEERAAKYLPLLQDLGKRRYVSFSEMERMVGK